MDLQSAESQKVITTLQSLVASLNECKRMALKEGSIKKAAFYSTTGQALDGDSSELFIRAISTWNAIDDDVHGAVQRFPAIVEASWELLACLQNLNACKAAFEHACEDLPGTSRERQLEMRAILGKQGMARAHPLQCWRKINVLDSLTPKSIGFSIARTSFSTIQMTKEEALDKLKLRDAQDVAEILEEEKCTSVRWVVPVSPHIKANVSYRGDQGSLLNAKLHASLPIVVAEGAWPEKWKFNLPKEPQVRKTSGRSIPLPFRTDAYLALA